MAAPSQAPEIAQTSGGGEPSPEERLRNYERWFQTLDSQIRDLEGERQKFSAIVNYTDAGFVLLDPDSRVVWTNSILRERFGVAGVVGGDEATQSCHNVVCRKASPCEDCPVSRVFARGTVAHHELSLPLSGRFHHVYATAMPVHRLDGQLEQAIVMLQDITDLKVLRRSEEALRSTEQRFRSIFEEGGAGMVTLRADGAFVQVNPTFCSMLGYTRSALLELRWRDVTHKDDLRKAARLFVEVQAGRRRSIEMEQRFIRRDGQPVWCHTTTVWQFDSQGAPTYSVVLIQDISERKRAEQALEQSRRRYEALVHSIDGIVWEADPRAFRCSFVSNQAERILGYPRERWLAQPRFWRNKIHPEDLERVRQALARLARTRRGSEVEYRMFAQDGRTVWVRDNLTVVVDESGVARLRGLMVDVTERKEAEEALRNSEEQLRQAQKMEAIGRLAGGVAHDFNNLLTAIGGYTDLLIRKLGESHPLYREAREISKAARRAADLTGQLLAFSRQQVMQPKALDLNHVVTDMQAMLQRVIGEHIVLETALRVPVAAVRADPVQLQQVVLNLAVNGRDAMPQGGLIRFETDEVELDEEQAARHAGMTPGRYICMAVTDNGCGMEPSTLARLFEPFFTTKEQGKGTGLGLSTVYGIVKQSGGHIEVESEPGRGTTFRIYLPHATSEEVEPAGPPQARPEARRGTETILLVEDNDAVRELACEILEMYGYTVVEAGNGAQALAEFEARQRRIDLLVTDLIMPEMGGRDLARAVAPLSPDLRVLYLSGYTDSVVLQQGMLDPGSFFLQKPFSPDDLASKVREALDT